MTTSEPIAATGTAGRPPSSAAIGETKPPPPGRGAAAVPFFGAEVTPAPALPVKPLSRQKRWKTSSGSMPR